MNELVLYSDQALAQRSRSGSATYPVLAALFVGTSAAGLQWFLLFFAIWLYRCWRR